MPALHSHQEQKYFWKTEMQGSIRKKFFEKTVVSGMAVSHGYNLKVCLAPFLQILLLRIRVQVFLHLYQDQKATHRIEDLYLLLF